MKIPAMSALAMLVAALPAAGAEEAGSVLPGIAEGLPAMITAWIVFGIVLVVLAKLVFPLIAKGLQAREDKIRQEITAAEQARKQAKDSLAMYERNLAEARAESQRMLEKTRAQQQAFADELRAKADLELAQLKERARRDIEIAKRAAMQEIYDAAISQATVIAARILEREVTSADQQRLVEESLRGLQTIKS